MEPMEPQYKGRTNWNFLFWFLLIAIGLIAVGLIFSPMLLYLAGMVLFIANLILMARRRLRKKRDQEKEWVNTDDLF